MLKDVKKAIELDQIFQENPMMIIDYAYEAIIDNVTLTEEQREVFDKNTKLLTRVPQGEIVKKMDMFLELDIFSNHFDVLEGTDVWKIIQQFSDEIIKQSRFVQ